MLFLSQLFLKYHILASAKRTFKVTPWVDLKEYTIDRVKHHDDGF